MHFSLYALIILVMFTIQISSATVFFQDETEVPGDQLIAAMNNASNISASPFPIHFFYNTHCGACQASVKYLEKFKVEYPDVAVEYHDLYNNTPSFALYEEYKKQFNRTDLYYPVIFMGNVGIMGNDDIASYTEPLTRWYQENLKINPLTGLFSWIKSFTKKNN